MKTPARLLVLLATAMAGNVPRAADLQPSEDQIRGHIDAQSPAHLIRRRTELHPLGDPVAKVRVVVEFEAAENLYREVSQEAPRAAVNAELPADIRDARPTLNLLKKVTGEGESLKALRFDIPVSLKDGKWAFGSVPDHIFDSAGKPRALCTPGVPSEESEEGRVTGPPKLLHVI
jgi:hypothetical protein